jgi:hypothetical protein
MLRRILPLVSAAVSAAAVPLTLIMFSGITGPIGYLAWVIVCFPAVVIGKGDDFILLTVVSGVSWGLIVTLISAVWRGSRS